MGIENGLVDGIAAGIATVADAAESIIDIFVTSDDDKLKAKALKLEFRMKCNELNHELKMKAYEDTENARAMYIKDSLLQKIVATLFVTAYFLITGFMIYMIFNSIKGEPLELPSWGVALISSVFGAMSSKVNTIIDFLFGGSQAERDNAAKIERTFTLGAGQNKQG